MSVRKEITTTELIFFSTDSSSVVKSALRSFHEQESKEGIKIDAFLTSDKKIVACSPKMILAWLKTSWIFN